MGDFKRRASISGFEEGRLIRLYSHLSEHHHPDLHSPLGSGTMLSNFDLQAFTMYQTERYLTGGQLAITLKKLTL